MSVMMNAATNQKSPSMWMVVAMAQTWFWFFGIPGICHRYWDAIFGSLSNRVAMFVLTWMSIVGTWVVYALVMLPIYYMQHPFWEQFKIQRDRPWPWLDPKEQVRQDFWALSKRSIRYTSVNLLCLAPILIAIQLVMEDKLGIANPSAFDTDPDSWPGGTLESFKQLITMAILHELGFYTTHRMMHTYPSLYKYHKIHHEYKTNTVLAAQHNHFVDFILSIGLPALFAILIVRPHSITILQLTTWSLYANMDDHVGYSFPWSPVRWFPFSATTDEHEFHHAKNLGCFGSKLNIWNTLLGGYSHYSYHIWKSK